ncbi:HMG box domain-containing protein [Meloidogyne graminicola]|uniref:Sex-determining region Y protein n=1 Tax=Meloidogyne graminicola TaxID=189291 RepID=A0A8S9ZTV4_9BILA|nr:HMG box domain-containing protein [Meloidogyne graminicola]
MISPENNATSPCNDSQCDESASPSSMRDIDNQSRASTHEHNNHSPQRNDDLSSDDPAEFSSLRSHSSLANISANIELHPQNDALGGGTSKNKFIKRPLNAYMIWTRQERKRILADDPKMKMNEVSKAIQMGERWKKMSDKEKKPYFELAKKYSEEHKQVLQDHPEFQYAPSKKKGPKKAHDGSVKGGGIQQQSMADSSSLKSCTATPEASRSTTPRGAANLIAPQPISQNQVFSPFQSPLASQMAQVLAQRVGNPGGHFGQTNISAPNVSMPGSILTPAGAFPQAFLPQGFPQRVAATSASLLGGISQAGSGVTANSNTGGVRTTPGQMLDLYYTSLCQPAFPNITENPVNPLGMYPPHYFLEQYNQQLTQQQQQQGGGQSGGGGNSNTNGGGQFG